MHLYYEYVASINVYLQRRSMQANASVRRCTTVALSVLLAPQVPGLVFCLFYKRLGFPSLSRASPARGWFQTAFEGVPEVVFGVIFEVIFGVILDRVGAIKSRLRLYDARVTEGMNAFVSYGFFACFSFAFSHFSHFLRSLH